MGIRRRVSSSSYWESPIQAQQKPDDNPNPNNYEIIRTEQFDGALLMEILYPDCTNYEGRKILLFKKVTLKQIIEQGSIDPHFMPENSKFHSPFARFEPTKLGWELGRHIGQLISKANKK
jgi:hypothetical protein